MREICLDTETTGLDPKDGHRIIEIGCVELINRIKTGNILHFYINPQRDMPEEAYKIHGLSEEFLSDKPKFEEIAEKFVNFVTDSILVIHNASFDMKFINYELRQCNLEIIERSKVVDSLEIARNKFPGSPNSLDALCKRFQVDASRRTKHGALLDAELLCEVYLELMGGNQISMFEDNTTNHSILNNQKDITSNTNQQSKRNFLKPRNFQVCETELKLHKEFIIKNFKNNLWGY